MLLKTNLNDFQFNSRLKCLVSLFEYCCLYDLLKGISVGTSKKAVLVCEFLREAMTRFLREHRTGDIFEFITSTVIQSRFILVCQQMYIFTFFCLVDVNPRFRTKLCPAVKYIRKNNLEFVGLCA